MPPSSRKPWTVGEQVVDPCGSLSSENSLLNNTSDTLALRCKRWATIDCFSLVFLCSSSFNQFLEEVIPKFSTCYSERLEFVAVRVIKFSSLLEQCNYFLANLLLLHIKREYNSLQFGDSVQSVTTDRLRGWDNVFNSSEAIYKSRSSLFKLKKNRILQLLPGEFNYILSIAEPCA